MEDQQWQAERLPYNLGAEVQWQDRTYQAWLELLGVCLRKVATARQDGATAGFCTIPSGPYTFLPNEPTDFLMKNSIYPSG
jgi:hypothetical protein